MQLKWLLLFMKKYSGYHHCLSTSQMKKQIKQSKISKRKTNSKILQRFGAVDENHVPNISPDTDCKPDYYPRRQMFSINIQVIVDGRLLFLDIGSRRIPWQSHDARIL